MIIVKHMATQNSVGRGRHTLRTGSGGPAEPPHPAADRTAVRLLVQRGPSRAPPTPRQTGQPRGSWCSRGPTRPLVPRPASRPPWSRCTSHSHPAARAGRQAARSESPNVEAAERGGRGAPRCVSTNGNLRRGRGRENASCHWFRCAHSACGRGHVPRPPTRPCLARRDTAPLLGARERTWERLRTRDAAGTQRLKAPAGETKQRASVAGGTC